MSELPNLELLEKAYTFPGVYMFKVIGQADPAFLGRALASVQEVLAIETEPPYRLRESVGGRHLSITLEPIVPSAEKVLAVYRRLSQLPGLVMMF